MHSVGKLKKKGMNFRHLVSLEFRHICSSYRHDVEQATEHWGQQQLFLLLLIHPLISERCVQLQSIDVSREDKRGKKERNEWVSGSTRRSKSLKGHEFKPPLKKYMSMSD